MDVNAVMNEARRLMELGQYQDAAKIWLALGNLDPTWEAGEYADLAGYCYEQMGDFEEAKKLYQTALEHNPEMPTYQESYRRIEQRLKAR